MRKYIIIGMISCCVMLSGCSISEIRRSFTGMMLQDFKQIDKKYSETFEKDKKTAYDEIMAFAKGQSIGVSRDDFQSGYVTLYGFGEMYGACIDTTEVGIFFEEHEAGKTVITIASYNSRLARNVSTIFFNMLKGIPPPNQSNKVKETK